MANLTIVMPAYNEQDSLERILPEWIEECQKNDWDLLIVNDGSSDNTQSILDGYKKTKSLRTLSHKVNRGYGAALKTGISNSQTKYVITIDSDGQHSIKSAHDLYNKILEDDSDLIIGTRPKNSGVSFRSLGKLMIRAISRFLLPNTISDLNSGLKIYNTTIAKKFLRVCPNSMAFSDVITLTFLAEKCKVTEYPITVQKRIAGKSTINLNSAIETVIEIINIVVFFNPLRVFLPISLILLVVGLAWGIPIIIQGRGVSVGSLLAITLSSIFFVIGLMAEQLSQIRKMLIQD
jgi:glycosyltransferase involved in cell wall biosynthesis